MTSSPDLVRRAKAGLGNAGSLIPVHRLTIVTCMDARVDPLPALSLQHGDAHVLRNAGAIVTEDVVRSLVVSQRFLETRRIDIMMHTDCGMIGLDSGALSRQIASEIGRAYDREFHGFVDLETELRRGVDRLRREPALLHRDAIRGLIYDVDTQRVQTVIE